MLFTSSACACAPGIMGNRHRVTGVVMVTTIFLFFSKIICKVYFSNQSWCKVSNNTKFVKIELVLTVQSDILTLISERVSCACCELRGSSGCCHVFCGAERVLKLKHYMLMSVLLEMTTDDKKE